MDLLEGWNQPDGMGAVDSGPAAPAPGQELVDVEAVKDYISRGRGTPVAVALAGDTIVVATSRNWLVRLSMVDGGPQAHSELDLQRSPDTARCQRLWVDPTGTHTLVLLSAQDPLTNPRRASEVLYVGFAWKKARTLSKLKNKPVTAAVFAEGISDESFLAGNILLGTAEGELLSLDVREPKREVVRLMHSLGPDEPVLAMRLLKRRGARAAGGPKPLVALVLSRVRLHAYWGGTGALEDCVSDIAPSSSLDLPDPATSCADITFVKPLQAPMPGRDGEMLEVAILCEQGILSAQIRMPAATEAAGGAAFLAPRVLPTPAVGDAIALACTAFHFVLLSKRALTLFNRVSKEVAQEIPLARIASPLRGEGEARDALGLLSASDGGGLPHTRVLLWAGEDLLELDATREDRDVWRAFLSVGDFASAALYCGDAAQRSAVYLAHGEACLKKGDWVVAGGLFGKVTTREPSFEELALRFMDAKQPEALQRFLEVRLDILSGQKDQLQRTLVASWLLELMLDRRNRAALAVADVSDTEEEEEEEGGGYGAAGEARASVSPRPVDRYRAAAGPEPDSLAAITSQLKAFLQTQHGVLDAGTTTELLVGYGQLDLLEAFALARRDLETVLELVLRRGDAERALQVLRDPDVGREVVYRFASALAALDPERAVDAWLRAPEPLDPARLLPALLAAASAGGAPGAAAVRRYLGVVLDEGAAARLGLPAPVTERALYDLMLDLLSAPGSEEGGREGEVDDDNGDGAGVATNEAEPSPEITRPAPGAAAEDALLSFLDSARTPLGAPRYDAKLALRLAQERGCPRAVVRLYEDLGLPGEAVKAALAFDQGLAVQVAQRAGATRGLGRRLWLDIAAHLIRHTDDPKDQAQGIALVSSLLENSKGVLHIEDVLPLFPEFTEIDAFRDVLCSALGAYNEEIEDLKREMAHSTRTAQAIRGYLAGLGGTVGVLGPDARCARCDRSLAAPPPLAAGPSGGAVPRLYLFPTGNAFHGACLAAEVAAVAPRLQRQRIAAALASLAAGKDVTRQLPELEQDVAQADPFWSEASLIQLVQKPFIDPGELEAELASWQL